MNIKNRIFDKLLFVTEDDYQCTLSQLYHENSKIGRLKYEFSLNASNYSNMKSMVTLTNMIDGKGKDYSFHESIEMDITNFANQQRRSRRHFNLNSVSKVSLISILSNIVAFRVDNHFRRGYPSAGGLYSIEIYPIIMNVEECVPGLYYLDVFSHKLMRLKQGINHKKLHFMFMQEEAALKSNVIILMTAVLPRLQIKYGQRGYRYAHLEAGHVAQVILEQCHKNKIAAFPVGGFIEREIEEYLDIDGHEEIALYSLMIGNSDDY